MNNLIESWNARLRDMMRGHRVLRPIHRIKVIIQWHHQHGGNPQPVAWPETDTITDRHVEDPYREA